MLLAKLLLPSTVMLAPVFAANVFTTRPALLFETCVTLPVTSAGEMPAVPIWTTPEEAVMPLKVTVVASRSRTA